MLTSAPTKRENIAEYLLYMWQVEDLIRAYGLDADRIKTELIDRDGNLDETGRKQQVEWFESLIDMMRREDKEKSGHLQLNINTLSELEELHARLLKESRYADYAAAYYDTLPLIVELRSKAGENRKDEIETCFDALYGLLMLRLAKKEISDDTLQATSRITKFLALLASYYKKDYNNELELQ